MPEFNVAALANRRCKVCTSPLCDGINLRLMGTETHEDGSSFDFAEIIDWAAAQGVLLSKAGLSRHYNNHLMPYVLNTMEAQRTVEAIAQAMGVHLGVETAFLQMVVTKNIKALDSGDLELTTKNVNAGIRATEALLKVKRAELHISKEKMDEAKDKMRSHGASENAIRVMDELLGLGKK